MRRWPRTSTRAPRCFETYSVPCRASLLTHSKSVHARCASTIFSGTTITGMECRASIIIPAHNEERRIRRLLQELSDVSLKDQYAVFVICNGCTDSTREVAETYAGIHVVEIEEVGKHFALNEGDRLAGDIFPRLYCDADVGLDANSLKRLVETLTTTKAVAAGPNVQYGVDGCSWGIKQYYKALGTPIMEKWLDLHLTGRGLYGASSEARKRFESFPPLYNDDDFFNSRYDVTERVVVPGAVVTIWTPTTMRELLIAETRVAMGNRQFNAFLKKERGDNGVDSISAEFVRSGLTKKLKTLRQWTRDIRFTDFIPIAVYLSVTGTTRVNLALQTIRRRQVSWR
jgi:glycosyltransferase involved in cell wall biosynthesis